MLLFVTKTGRLSHFYIETKKLGIINCNILNVEVHDWMQLNIAICDSDFNYRQYLRNLLEMCLDMDEIQVYEFDCGMKILKNHYVDFDALFISNELQNPSGNEIAKRLRDSNCDGLIIFCSKNVMLSPETLKVTPFRHLCKQLPHQQVLNEIKEITDELHKKNKTVCILTHFGQKRIKVRVENITYISKYRNGCRVFTDTGICSDDNKLLMSVYIDEMYQRLKNQGFEFAHSSYIVNLNKIIMLDGQEIVFDNGTILTVSRSRYKKFYDIFIGQYLQF